MTEEKMVPIEQLITEGEAETISVNAFGFSLLNRFLNERGARLVVTDLGPPIQCYVERTRKGPANG